MSTDAAASYVRIATRYRRKRRNQVAEEVMETMSLALSDAVLLLIDVFPREGPPADIVRRAIAPARAMARHVGLPVVFVTNQLVESIHESSESRSVWRRTLGEDVLETWREPSERLRYLPEIAPAPGDLVVAKPFYSGFSMTRLDEVLTSLGSRILIVAGFEAHICVTATVTDALYRNYRVIVLRDAISILTGAGVELVEPEVDHAIRYIESCVGYTATTADLLTALEHRRQRA